MSKFLEWLKQHNAEYRFRRYAARSGERVCVEGFALHSYISESLEACGACGAQV